TGATAAYVAGTTASQYAMCVKYAGDGKMSYTKAPYPLVTAVENDGTPMTGYSHYLISDGRNWIRIGDVVSDGGANISVEDTSSLGESSLGRANFRLNPEGCAGGQCALEARASQDEFGGAVVRLTNAKDKSQSLLLDPIFFMQNLFIPRSALDFSQFPIVKEVGLNVSHCESGSRGHSEELNSCRIPFVRLLDSNTVSTEIASDAKIKVTFSNANPLDSFGLNGNERFPQSSPRVAKINDETVDFDATFKTTFDIHTMSNGELYYGVRGRNLFRYHFWPRVEFDLLPIPVGNGLFVNSIILDSEFQPSQKVAGSGCEDYTINASLYYRCPLTEQVLNRQGLIKGIHYSDAIARTTAITDTETFPVFTYAQAVQYCSYFPHNLRLPSATELKNLFNRVGSLYDNSSFRWPGKSYTNENELSRSYLSDTLDDTEPGYRINVNLDDGHVFRTWRENADLVTCVSS
uniref:hypothetical protein n=1 Tax=Aeromonas enteropelogenes TaxID=29489 RepID=UPI003BA3C754